MAGRRLLCRDLGAHYCNQIHNGQVASNLTELAPKNFRLVGVLGEEILTIF
jgi:hypothetical protein